jgi:plasmid stabilization system protein ParE
VSYWLHPDAEHDVADAVDFYLTNAGRSVALRFLTEFERVATLLVEHPGLGTPSSKGRRTFPLRVFPYSLVYRTLDNGIRIIVVRHQYRKPGFGEARQ